MSDWRVDVSGSTVVIGPGGTATLRAKERSIVAALALHHPAPATAASLAPLIWGDELPNTAIKSVHNHVSRIRTSTPNLIDTGELGYRFQDGTEIWCSGGPASYLDLADQPTVAVARARDRVQAMRRAEEEIRERVRSGADDDLLSDVEDLVDAAPHRLLRWWWQALLTARLGRRQRALEILRECRRGPVHLDAASRGALDLFERAIADDDVFLDSPAAADPRSLGADAAAGPDPFSTVAPVGILDATGVVASTISAIDDGARTVSVMAPAGGGKSSLLRAIGERLPPLGWHCFTTTCSPSDIDPLAPLIDLATRRSDRSGDTTPLSRVGESAGDYSTALLASLTAPATRRVLFIVDDVHYASPEAVGWLQRLADGAVDTQGQVAVLFATRPGAPAKIDTEVEIELPPWGRSAVEAYLHSFAAPGAWTHGAARWIEVRADGNPLFVRELTIDALRRLPDDPVNVAFVEPDVASLVSGQSGLRLESLPERLRRTLITAATLGEQFRRSDLAALTDNVTPMLALGHAHGLIEPVDTERHRFVHQRFRQSFLDLLDADEQIALAQRAATVITNSADAGDRLAELAEFARTASSRDPERAIVATVAQAEAALAELRLEEALSLGRLAMQLIDDVEGRTSRWASTAVLAGAAAVDTGDPDASELLIAGGMRAIELEDHETVGNASARLSELSPTTRVGQADAATDALFEHAYRYVTDPAHRAMVCRGGAFASTLADDPETSRRLYFEADKLSRRAGDRTVRADVLAAAYTPLSRPDDVPRRREIATELHALATELDRADLAYAAHRLDFSHAISWGSGDPRVPMVSIERIARRLGQRSRNWSLYAYRATIALLGGDTEEAERLATMVLGDDVTASEQLKTTTYGAHLFAIRLLQDRMSELDPLVLGLLEDQPDLMIWRAVRVATAAIDDPAAARVAFDDVFSEHEHRIPESFTMLAGLVYAGEGALRLGDSGRMRIMIGHLTPYEDRWGWFNVGSVGPVDLTLARLHAAVGAGTDARRCAVRGLRSTVRVDAPAYAAGFARLLSALR
ncbi:MAG: AAA family ATPase [Ilumatobacter sp.]|uniref:AAA family ATPase n=1 Tax=Ilumatobacter sp. TaxID=1967498 RepID=UPI003C7616B5